MRPPIQNGTILLTGASSGIGRELARQLAPLCKRLILVARRKERLDELKKELEAQHAQLEVLSRACDLVDLDKTAELMDRLDEEVDGVDILINNAGLGDVGVLEFSDFSKLQKMITLNITSLTYLTHRVVGPMRKRGRGGILNISSGFGLQWMPGFSSYVGTKHYVTAFTESLRCELAGTGVVVSQVCPGPVATEFEANAGNPTEQSVPKWLELSASQCAKESLRGFKKGKALIIPGLSMRLITFMGGMTPRFVLRFFYGFAGKYLYKQQLKHPTQE